MLDQGDPDCLQNIKFRAFRQARLHRILADRANQIMKVDGVFAQIRCKMHHGVVARVTSQEMGQVKTGVLEVRLQIVNRPCDPKGVIEQAGIGNKRFDAGELPGVREHLEEALCPVGSRIDFAKFLLVAAQRCPQARNHIYEIAILLQKGVMRDCAHFSDSNTFIAPGIKLPL